MDKNVSVLLKINQLQMSLNQVLKKRQKILKSFIMIHEFKWLREKACRN